MVPDDGVPWVVVAEDVSNGAVDVLRRVDVSGAHHERPLADISNRFACPKEVLRGLIPRFDKPHNVGCHDKGEALFVPGQSGRPHGGASCEADEHGQPAEGKNLLEMYLQILLLFLDAGESLRLVWNIMMSGGYMIAEII
jgi:hypothetical protein